MKLLLAEDDALLADALSTQLRGAGFEVQHAPNGAVAEFLLERETHDIAVLDLGLPMLDGLAVLHKVRARQPDREAKALRGMALAALRFSPHLCLKPDGFLIEVQGSLRLFGGPLNLWRQLVHTVDAFKVSTRRHHIVISVEQRSHSAKCA